MLDFKLKMMRVMQNRYLFVILITTLFACTKPYNPPAITDTVSYLVVEGTINPGSDSTVINLSHTVSLSTAVTQAPELNATVTIESNQNNSYPLTSTGHGRYVSAPLNATGNTNQYRLRILRSNGKTYLSDFVQVKNSPAIDTVSYTLKNNAVQISTATHDATGNSRYYRWDYTETYLFHSAFNSALMVVHNPDTIVNRPLADQIYQCWLTDTATYIYLNSSAKLTQDIITNQPIASIPLNSEKFEALYSIQVNQYALTPDAFNYYQQLLTNSQGLGSIFSALPTVLTGNIHCVNTPAEYVLGYLSAGIIAHKRIFINPSILPTVSGYATPYGGCTLDAALYNDPQNVGVNEVVEWLYSGLDIPISVIPGKGYVIGYPFCTDCRVRGTTTKPSFWP